MQQRRSLVLLLALLLYSLLFTAPVFAEDDDEAISLDEAAADMAGEGLATMAEEAASMAEAAKEAVEDAQEMMEEASKSAAEEVQQTKETIEDAVEQATESIDKFADNVKEGIEAAVSKAKGNKPSIVEKANAFLKKLNKKKVAAWALGAWGVTVGVGWLSSKATSTSNDAVPVRLKP